MTHLLEYIAPYLISNLIAIVILVGAWKRPRAAQWVCGVIFLWASITNAATAIVRPRAYLEYASLTVSWSYREFITGWFSDHIQLLVLSVAAGQFVIAALLLA